MSLALSYSLLAALILMLSAGLSMIIRLPKNSLSFLQHFAAGVIFSAVAVELIPRLLQSHLKWDIALGFLVGVLCMLLIRKFGESNGTSPTALLTGYGVDLWIDGVLIALAFLAAERSGIIITGALCLEVTFLMFALVPTLKSRGASKITIATACLILAALIPFGTAIGYLVIYQLPAGVFEGTLAFGVAALLYLVTEELLYEAHQKVDSALGTAAFFFGFLVILLL